MPSVRKITMYGPPRGSLPVLLQGAARASASSMAVPPMGRRPSTNVARLGDVRRVRGDEAAEQRLGLRGKPDDLEPVIRAEIGKAEPQRLLCLVELGSCHGSRGVQDEADVLGLDARRGRRTRGSQEHEVPVLTGLHGWSRGRCPAGSGVRLNITLKSVSGQTSRPSHPTTALRSPSRRISAGWLGQYTLFSGSRPVEGHLHRDVLHRGRAELFRVQRDRCTRRCPRRSSGAGCR